MSDSELLSEEEILALVEMGEKEGVEAYNTTPVRPLSSPTRKKRHAFLRLLHCSIHRISDLNTTLLRKPLSAVLLLLKPSFALAAELL